MVDFVIIIDSQSVPQNMGIQLVADFYRLMEYRWYVVYVTNYR